MADPKELGDSVGVGTFLLGVLWAMRELLPKFMRGDGAEYRVTVSDVLDEVRANGSRLESISSTLAHLLSEESRIHGSIEAKLDRTVAPLSRLNAIEEKLDRLIVHLAHLRGTSEE